MFNLEIKDHSFNILTRKKSTLPERIESAKRKAVKSRVVSNRKIKVDQINKSGSKVSKKIIFNSSGSPVVSMIKKIHVV